MMQAAIGYLSASTREQDRSGLGLAAQRFSLGQGEGALRVRARRRMARPRARGRGAPDEWLLRLGDLERWPGTDQSSLHGRVRADHVDR